MEIPNSPKTNFKRIKDLNVKNKTFKLLFPMGEWLYEIGVGKKISNKILKKAKS